MSKEIRIDRPPDDRSNAVDDCAAYLNASRDGSPRTARPAEQR
jgi:hypothetical protein